MHYKNGRVAHNGDKVVYYNTYNGNVYASVIGILYDAQPGNDACNGKIAPINPMDACPNLAECLHLEDVIAALPNPVPDSSTTGV
jgi:hypothetical protein